MRANLCWSLIATLFLAAAFLAAAFPAPAALAQESVRELSGPGQQGKFLTPGQVDRWLFEGAKGESILAEAASKEFDPVLELARGGLRDEGKPLIEVDDPGAESRFSFRLPESGPYNIRVRGYKHQGGGNYTLRVRRFVAKPVAVGQSAVGDLDRAGKGWVFFQAAKDRVIIPDVKGLADESWTMLDAQGRPLGHWAGSVQTRQEGEYHLELTGPPNRRYELTLREATRRALPLGEAMAGSLKAGEMDAWSFHAKAGDFRLLEVEKKGAVRARLIRAPEEDAAARLARPDARPDLRFVPAASRGGRLRFAAFVGRDGPHQLQLLAETDLAYTLNLRDPSTALAWNEPVAGQLDVGGAVFYRVAATPGQLLRARVATEQFAPRAWLYDPHGDLVAEGRETDALDSGLTHMVAREGPHLLQVSSLGDGGGGKFSLALTEVKVRELKLGERANGRIALGATDFWMFAGKEGQTVFLNVRSDTLEPTVEIRGVDGVALAANATFDTATGALSALKLPKTGRYTVWVSSRRGEGEYAVRLIDGD